MRVTRHPFNVPDGNTVGQPQTLRGEPSQSSWAAVCIDPSSELAAAVIECTSGTFVVAIGAPIVGKLVGPFVIRPWGHGFPFSGFSGSNIPLAWAPNINRHPPELRLRWFECEPSSFPEKRAVSRRNTFVTLDSTNPTWTTAALAGAVAGVCFAGRARASIRINADLDGAGPGDLRASVWAFDVPGTTQQFKAGNFDGVPDDQTRNNAGQLRRLDLVGNGTYELPWPTSDSVTLRGEGQVPGIRGDADTLSLTVEEPADFLIVAVRAPTTPVTSLEIETLVTCED
jgi:hypothetical protein